MTNEQYPILWFVNDEDGNRLGTLVYHTFDEALQAAEQLYSARTYVLVDSGKRKPPNKCCDHCSDTPCGST